MQSKGKNIKQLDSPGMLFEDTDQVGVGRQGGNKYGARQAGSDADSTECVSIGVVCTEEHKGKHKAAGTDEEADICFHFHLISCNRRTARTTTPVTGAYKSYKTHYTTMVCVSQMVLVGR